MNNDLKAGFPLGEFVRANREKSNLIGWRQTLTTSTANHMHVLLVRANKFAKWKTDFRHVGLEGKAMVNNLVESSAIAEENLSSGIYPMKNNTVSG